MAEVGEVPGWLGAAVPTALATAVGPDSRHSYPPLPAHSQQVPGHGSFSTMSFPSWCLARSGLRTARVSHRPFPQTL